MPGALSEFAVEPWPGQYRPVAHGNWLTAWLKSPEKMLASDPIAQALLKEHNNLPMPNQSLSDAEIRQYIEYFRWIDARPAGSVAAVAAH